ncbi:MAG TPA: glutathione synthase [Paenalcaligenes sp.]|nr:glutathione synthase [Paenalcaligenes sp.]
MHILFIIDPLESLAAYKDTSVSMMRALIARGHEISVCEMTDIFVRDGLVLTHSLALDIPQEADLHSAHWWQPKGSSTEQALSNFSAVIMRTDPPFDLEYMYATHLFDQAQAQGARVFNSGAAIRNHPEKLSILEFPQFTAPTMVTSQMAHLHKFYQEHKDVVIKPLDGMGGERVFRLRPDEVNRNVIFETLTRHETETVMIQRYIPAIEQGDKRVIIINGQVVPYSLARIPLAGETRGNLAAGGRGVAQPLTENDRKIAETLAPVLSERGLFVIGLDIIGDKLTEINVTSPTCFVEIAEQSDFHVPNFFAEELERVVTTQG